MITLETISITAAALTAAVVFCKVFGCRNQTLKDVIGFEKAKVGKGGIKKHALGKVKWNEKTYRARLAAGSRLDEVKAGRTVQVVQVGGNLVVVKPLAKKSKPKK